MSVEHLAGALLRRGRLGEAIEVAQQAVTIGRDSGSHSGQLFALGTLARALIADGQLERGLQTTVVALGRAIDIANVGGVADGLDSAAVLLESCGQHDVAVELLGLSSGLREQRRVVVPLSVAGTRTALEARLTDVIGESTFGELERSGHGRTVDWALELVTNVAENPTDDNS